MLEFVRHFARNFFAQKVPIFLCFFPVFPSGTERYHTFCMYFFASYIRRFSFRKFFYATFPRLNKKICRKMRQISFLYFFLLFAPFCAGAPRERMSFCTMKLCNNSPVGCPSAANTPALNTPGCPDPWWRRRSGPCPPYDPPDIRNTPVHRSWHRCRHTTAAAADTTGSRLFRRPAPSPPG